jgi:alkanesulfonate monooxygenase SsuD/methylene tetrahydromethanopterin reductase-like flavin-dependent oxidoreductase (luciferase family)
MANFVDIFATLTRILLVYYRRGIVKSRRLIGRYCDLIAVASEGRHTEEEEFKGYLSSAFANLGRDASLLQEVCDETGYLGELRAALLIVQDIRTALERKGDGTKPPARPRDMLGLWAGLVRSALRSCRLAEPPAEKVREALTRYGVLNAEEVSRLLRELPASSAH